MLPWLTCFFIVLYAGLLGYYAFFWKQVKPFTPADPITVNGFVSVVVAARNEAGNIENLLLALSRQTLPRHRFEVIIVDDYSTDETAALVAPFIADNIRLIQPIVPAHQSSKKRAIEAGVAVARGPLVAVTDADCIPSTQWLQLLLSFYHYYNAAFIVAPVRLQYQPTLLGVFQALDFTMLQGITAASAQAGAHSMCNGANLAYEKQAFTEVGGFAGIDKLASGDDMLLLHKIWKRHPERVHYLLHEKAIMPTPALKSWKAFFLQRLRWSSKATYYDDWRISAVLFFVYAFNMWFFVLLGAVLLKALSVQWLIIYLLGKTIAELLLLYPAAGFFNIRKALVWFPLLQPLHILYTVVIGLASRKGSYQWKGRKTK